MHRTAIAVVVLLSLWGSYEVGQHTDYKAVCDALGVPENGYVMANGMKITRDGIKETVKRYGNSCSVCHFGEGY